MYKTTLNRASVGTEARFLVDTYKYIYIVDSLMSVNVLRLYRTCIHVRIYFVATSYLLTAEIYIYPQGYEGSRYSYGEQLVQGVSAQDWGPRTGDFERLSDLCTVRRLLAHMIIGTRENVLPIHTYV